jgi:nucleotide-binding universal stress UspA family protein
MLSEGLIVVAVEDVATAEAVAVGAARCAMEQSATRVILLHVLDSHGVVNGLASLAGAPVAIVETAEEGASVLARAEAILGAEYRARHRPVPSLIRELGEDGPGPTIAQVARDAGATAIVVGARRPHAFGRLTHPDVLEYLRHHTRLPVHVVSLQTGVPPNAEVRAIDHRTTTLRRKGA